MGIRASLRRACQAGSVALLPLSAANAQVAPDAATSAEREADTGLTEIVVTAQRRRERLQDVPITVNAVTAETLRAAEIRSTSDLTLVVPGLRANVQTGYFQPFIRGIGGSSTLPGNESPVAVYIDGVYSSMKEANNFDFNNIERIEVLKGPQGTLFGRNATGGAISIITRSPETREASFNVSYGRFDEVIANAYLAGPLTEELSASVSLRYQNIAEGYSRNIVTGSDFATPRSFTALGKLRWAPTPELSVTGEIIYTTRSTVDDDQATVNPAIRPKGANVPGAILSYTPYRVALNNNPILSLDDKKYILNASYDAGPVRIVSITGYDHGDALSQAERDRSSASQQFTAANTFVRQFTQEVQLQSAATASPFSWIIGGYYFDTREGYRPFTTLLNFVGQFALPDVAANFGRPGASAALINATQYARSLAGFAEATYEFAPATRLTAGFRYTTEKRRVEGIRQLVTAPPPGTSLVYTTTATMNLRKTFSRPTWRVALDHKFSPEIMAYASYNRGFRSGAYNPSSISATQIPLDPESIDAYELGLKTELFDRHLRLNIAGFYYDYRDIHVSVRTPSTGTIVQQNAGGAEIYGVDIDLTARPSRRLTLSGGINLLHARYNDYKNASTFVIDPVNAGGVQVTIADAAGQPLAFAPDVSANLGATYDLPLAGGSRFSLQGNYFITGKFSRQVGIILGKEEVQGYDSLSASLSWYAPDDKFYVRAWGRNLTNHKVLGSTLDSFAYFYVVQRPVTYGLSLGFSFGG